MLPHRRNTRVMQMCHQRNQGLQGLVRIIRGQRRAIIRERHQMLYLHPQRAQPTDQRRIQQTVQVFLGGGGIAQPGGAFHVVRLPQLLQHEPQIRRLAQFVRQQGKQGFDFRHQGKIGVILGNKKFFPPRRQTLIIRLLGW